MMNDEDIEQMLQWLNVPVADQQQLLDNGTPDLQQMIRQTQENDELEQDEYTTNKHVVVNDIAYFEQMALILNLYYHTTTGAKMMNVVDLDSNPDAIQMHLQNK